MFSRLGLRGQPSKPPPLPQPAPTVKTAEDIQAEKEEANRKAEEDRHKAEEDQRRAKEEHEMARKATQEASRKYKEAVALAELNKTAITELFSTKLTPLIQKINSDYDEAIKTEITTGWTGLLESSKNKLKEIYSNPELNVNFLNRTKNYHSSELDRAMTDIFHKKIVATVKTISDAYIVELTEPLYNKIRDVADNLQVSEVSEVSKIAQNKPSEVTYEGAAFDNDPRYTPKKGGLSKKQRKPRKKRRVTKKSKKKLN
jgi:hypothetical protein